MLLAVSDTVWTALIGGTFALATAVVGAFVAIRTQAAKVNNEAMDAKVSEVSDRMDPLVELAEAHRRDAIAAREEAAAAREEARVARVEARNEHAIARAFEQRTVSQEETIRFLRAELREARGSVDHDGAHVDPEDPVPERPLPDREGLRDRPRDSGGGLRGDDLGRLDRGGEPSDGGL